MARIDEAVIERIKREVPVAERAEAFGIELKPHGADRIGRCPFHDDRTPSLVVSPSKNLWHCLGACQTGGSVIDWVMRTQGLSFRAAAQMLAGELSGGATAPAAPAQPVIDPGETGPQAPDDAALLDRVIGFYHRTLQEAPEALDYLRRRGLDHPELIETFRLGYANRTLGLRLPKKKLKAGRELRARLQAVGMLRASGHEHFNGCLVVPVIDEAGQVAEVYGRKLRDDLRPGTAYHLYRPGPHAGVWNISALAATDEVILCESLIDAMTFWCAGYRHVTASYGTGGFTADHLEAFQRHGIRRVLIAYDADAAGDAAAEDHARQLGGAGIAAFRVRFARGEDANSTACAAADPAAVLGDALRAAEWIEGSAAPAGRQADEDGADEALPGLSDLDEPAADAESEPAPPQATAQPVASPLPPPPSAPELPCEVTETEVRLGVGDRGYRVRGLDTNGAEAMKINLRVHRGAGDDLAFHLDTLDLYQAKARRAYTVAAAEAVGVEPAVIERDLGRVLLQLETVQEQRRQAAAQPQTKEPQLSEAERDAALAWLREPDLIGRLREDLARSGVVGETTNTLVAYLVATSRLLARPLALIVQSSSAAGKSSLLEAVLALFPETSRAQYAALTGQSLYYLGEHELSHRILAVAEEEGAAQATYALKLLQSEGRLTIASTGKDPVTGNLQTQQYRVEGPVALMLTTTAAELDAELANRCLVVGVDEDRGQTAAIQAEQRRRRTRAGLEASRERDRIRSRHHAIQQMLEPVAVVNPYAERLTFAAEPTRTRRDHEKYLTLIEAIALLHQHQRPIHTLGDDEDGEAVRYIEATLDDIALANELAHAVLGRTLDELPPQTQRLLGEIQRFVEADRQAKQIDLADYRFSRRELRSATGWGDTQLKVHLSRLVELEYLLVHRQGPRFVYELVFDGTADAGAAPHCNGLIDAAALRAGEGLRPADPDRSDVPNNRSGNTANRSGSGRAGVGSRSDDSEDPESTENARSFNPLAAEVPEAVGISPDARPEPKNHHRPYTPTGVLS